ncbi:hypothetical protein ACJX0J_031320, partial [Zea mays]
THMLTMRFSWLHLLITEFILEIHWNILFAWFGLSNTTSYSILAMSNPRRFPAENMHTIKRLIYGQKTVMGNLGRTSLNSEWPLFSTDLETEMQRHATEGKLSAEKLYIIVHSLNKITR